MHKSHVLPRALVALCVLGSVFLLGRSSAFPTAERFSEKDEACLHCHTDSGLVERPGGGEPLPPAIDRGEYAASPHRALGCGACHGEVAAEAHPGKKRASDGESSVARWSRTCRSCHGEGQIKEKSIHGYLLTQANSPPCYSCHAPHRVKNVREWKIKVSTSLYCLTCHQQALSVSLGGGETFTLTIGDALLGASVHLSHECTDCHAGYSKQEHAVRDIQSKRTHSLAAYATCRECHPDKYELFEGSIHYKLANRGHAEAPLCTDCHGHHDVKHKAQFEMLSGIPCRRCHEESFATYRESRHGQAVAVKGHLDAPLCSDCHRAHDITYASLKRPVTESCLGCHEDAVIDHRKWLPKVGEHFEAVSCAVCHIPAPRGKSAVSIYDTAARKTVPKDTALRGAGGEYAKQAGAAADEQDLAFWGDVVSELNGREGRGESRYIIRLGVQDGVAAHELGHRDDACKQCDGCHQGCVEYLDKVFFEFR